MKKFYNETCINVESALKTSVSRGLNEDEIEERRKGLGSNEIEIPNGEKYIFKNILKIEGLYLIMHLLAMIYLFVQGEIVLGAVLGIAFIFIFYIRFIFIKKNNEQVEYIDNINSATVEVLRSGREKIIKSKEIVLGDVIIFKKGSLIPADVRIVELKDLKVDESSVTGEKFLKEKYDYKMPSNPSNIGEVSNMLFKGSIIKEGEGKGIVVSVGRQTYIGGLLSALKDKTFEKNNIYTEIERRIGIQILVLLSISISIGFLLKANIALLLYMIFAVPMVGILFLNIKILKKEFKERGIKIVNPSVIKKINNIDVIFLDKIGGISEEEVSINSLFTNLKITLKKDIRYSSDINMKRALDILSLSSVGDYDKEKDIVTGEIRDRGYIKFLASLGEIRETIKFRNREIFKIGMESNKRFITTINKGKKGYRANCRGHLENILECCTHIMIEGVEKELTAEDREKIRGCNYNFLTRGLITEGIAYRSFEYKPDEKSNVESNLVFVGIIALENRLYEDAKERISKLKQKNIIPILFTEDNKITATTIGLKTGLVQNKDEVLSGVEINNLSGDEFIEVLSKTKIFSKVSPELKGRIVNLFTKEGYKVLSLGENIGDLATLSLAEVGVGKGEGLKIVRKVSDIFIEKEYLKEIEYLLDASSSIYKKIMNLNKIYFINLIVGIGIIAIFEVLLKTEINIWFITIGMIVNYILHCIGISQNEKVERIIKDKNLIIYSGLIFLLVGFSGMI